MKEIINEDIFDQIPKANAICITTNCTVNETGSNIMGGGVAGAAVRRYPQLPSIYGKLLNITGHVPVILGWVYHDDPSEFVSVFEADASEMNYSQDVCAIIAYPTMHDISESADLDLVVSSGCVLAEMSDTFGWEHIFLVDPGIGIGGLDWEEQVKPELVEILDERFHVMRIVQNEVPQGWTTHSTRGWKANLN